MILGLALVGSPACQAEVKTSADVRVGEPEDEAPKWEGIVSEDGTPQAGVRFARAVEPNADAGGGPPTVTLPGFQTYDDGSCRVFLEVSGGSVEVETLRTPRGFTYRFLNTRVPERVNQLPLPTSQFDAVVSKVVVNRDGDDAVLVVETAYAVEPRNTLKRSKRGTVLSVDFPRKPLPDEQLDPLPPPPDEPTRLTADESEGPTAIQAPTLPVAKPRSPTP